MLASKFVCAIFGLEPIADDFGEERAPRQDVSSETARRVEERCQINDMSCRRTGCPDQVVLRVGVEAPFEVVFSDDFCRFLYRRLQALHLKVERPKGPLIDLPCQVKII